MFSFFLRGVSWVIAVIVVGIGVMIVGFVVQGCMRRGGGGGRVIGDEREIKKLIAMVGRLEDGFNEVVYEMSEYIEGGPDDFEFDELAWNFGDFMDDFWVLSKGLKEVYGDALTSVSAGAHDVMNAHKDLEDALIAYEGKCLGVSYDRVDEGMFERCVSRVMNAFEKLKEAMSYG